MGKSARRRGEGGDTICVEFMGKFKSFRLRRFQVACRKNVSEKRQAEMATEVGINSVGNYDHVETGRGHSGGFACFGW